MVQTVPGSPGSLHLLHCTGTAIEPLYQKEKKSRRRAKETNHSLHQDTYRYNGGSDEYWWR